MPTATTTIGLNVMFPGKAFYFLSINVSFITSKVKEGGGNRDEWGRCNIPVLSSPVLFGRLAVGGLSHTADNQAAVFSLRKKIIFNCLLYAQRGTV